MTTTTELDPVLALLGSGRLAVTDSGTRMATARIRASDGDAVWTTRLHEDGWTSCTCPAARYRPRSRCTHVLGLLRVCAWSLRAALTDDRRDRPVGEEEEKP